MKDLSVEDKLEIISECKRHIGPDSNKIISGHLPLILNRLNQYSRRSIQRVFRIYQQQGFAGLTCGKRVSTNNRSKLSDQIKQ